MLLEVSDEITVNRVFRWGGQLTSSSDDTLLVSIPFMLTVPGGDILMWLLCSRSMLLFIIHL